MDEEQLIRCRRYPSAIGSCDIDDVWAYSHAAARIFNNQIALYPHSHDAAAAAKALDALTPMHVPMAPELFADGFIEGSSEGLGGFLWGFWGMVLDLCYAYEDTENAQNCMVDIIAELQKIDVGHYLIGPSCSLSETHLWIDLPYFEGVLMEFGELVKNPGYDKVISFRRKCHERGLLNLYWFGEPREDTPPVEEGPDWYNVLVDSVGGGEGRAEEAEDSEEGEEKEEQESVLNLWMND